MSNRLNLVIKKEQYGRAFSINDSWLENMFDYFGLYNSNWIEGNNWHVELYRDDVKEFIEKVKDLSDEEKVKFYKITLHNSQCGKVILITNEEILEELKDLIEFLNKALEEGDSNLGEWITLAIF